VLPPTHFSSNASRCCVRRHCTRENTPAPRALEKSRGLDSRRRRRITPQTRAAAACAGISPVRKKPAPSALGSRQGLGGQHRCRRVAPQPRVSAANEGTAPARKRPRRARSVAAQALAAGAAADAFLPEREPVLRAQALHPREYARAESAREKPRPRQPAPPTYSSPNACRSGLCRHCSREKKPAPSALESSRGLDSRCRRRKAPQTRAAAARTGSAPAKTSQH
jgi:hypothetical protein